MIELKTLEHEVAIEKEKELRNQEIKMKFVRQKITKQVS